MNKSFILDKKFDGEKAIEKPSEESLAQKVNKRRSVESDHTAAASSAARMVLPGAEGVLSASADSAQSDHTAAASSAARMVLPGAEGVLSASVNSAESDHTAAASSAARMVLPETEDVLSASADSAQSDHTAAASSAARMVLPETEDVLSASADSAQSDHTAAASSAARMVLPGAEGVLSASVNSAQSGCTAPAPSSANVKVKYGDFYRQHISEPVRAPKRKVLAQAKANNSDTSRDSFTNYQNLPNNDLSSNSFPVKSKKSLVEKTSATKRLYWHAENAVLDWTGRSNKENEDEALEDIKKSVNLGIRSKGMIERSLTGMNKSMSLAAQFKKTMQAARQSFVRAKRAKQTGDRVKNIYQFSKQLIVAGSQIIRAAVSFFAAAPVILIVIGVLALVCVLGGSLSGFLMTQHAASPETLSEIHAYITEKSTAIGYEFQNYKRLHSPDFDDVLDEDVFLDAKVTPFSQPTQKIVNYFSAKYEAQLNLEDVKSEIDTIIGALFTISHEVGQRIETVENTVEKPVLNDDGEFTYDEDGNVITETVIEEETKTFRTLTVTLDGMTFDEWFQENASFGKEQMQRYDIFNEMNNIGIGGGSIGNIGSIGSPFPEAWTVSSPYGYRVDPVTGEQIEFHLGVDIPKPYGTPIYSVTSGTVTSTTGHWSYGNTFVITGSVPDGSLAVRYAHCASFVVSDGQVINAGDLIGYVGSTGNSTGNHVHIEMHLNGTRINPMLYLQNPGVIE